MWDGRGGETKRQTKNGGLSHDRRLELAAMGKAIQSSCNINSEKKYIYIVDTESYTM